MFEDWETTKQTEDDPTHQLEKLAAQQLGVKPPSPSGIPTSLRLAVQKASNERNAAEVRIEEYISSELLAKGKLIARGIPNEAPHTTMNRSISNPHSSNIYDYPFRRELAGGATGRLVMQ